MESELQTAAATALPAEAMPQTFLRAWWRRLEAMSTVVSNRESFRWGLAIADQAVVSGTRFLTAIILGRFGGADELGAFSLAFTILLLAGCVQEALLTTPYAVFGSRLGRRARSTYGGGVLLIHAILAAGGSLALVAAACLLWLGHGSTLWETMAIALAAAFPCSLLWEFARRTTLAHLNVATAFLIDLLVAGLQLSGLIALAVFHELSASHALAVVGLACVIVGGIWLASTWRRRRMRPKLTHLYWIRNWRFGRWLFAGQLVGAVHGLAPTWILATIVGTQIAGAFVACLNMALLANPLIFAVGNLLTPRASHAFTAGGKGGVARVVWTAEALMGAVLLSFACLLFAWGDRLVALVYGSSYSGFGIIPGLLGLCAAAWGTSAVFASGLAAIKRPQWSFAASLTGTTISALAIAIAASRWHSLGAAAGLLSGSLVGASLHVVAFARCIGAD
jgi:O-antigen/teichoic acid export membrane protein